MEIHPKFHKRWAEIFIRKWDHESQDEALSWARRVIPKSEGVAVKEQVRALREQGKGTSPGGKPNSPRSA